MLSRCASKCLPAQPQAACVKGTKRAIRVHYSLLGDLALELCEEATAHIERSALPSANGRKPECSVRECGDAKKWHRVSGRRFAVYGDVQPHADLQACRCSRRRRTAGLAGKVRGGRLPATCGNWRPLGHQPCLVSTDVRGVKGEALDLCVLPHVG